MKKEKMFRIVSEGSPFTTNIYYGDEKIPCVKKVVVSADVKSPVLRAEVVLNLVGSNCNLEIDYENMIISFGNERFKLIPVEEKIPNPKQDGEQRSLYPIIKKRRVKNGRF